MGEGLLVDDLRLDPALSSPAGRTAPFMPRALRVGGSNLDGRSPTKHVDPTDMPERPTHHDTPQPGLPKHRWHSRSPRARRGGR
jgi:hypothetical protein